MFTEKTVTFIPLDFFFFLKKTIAYSSTKEVTSYLFPH